MHRNNPDSMMLNTAQMRDVHYLQRFHVPSGGLQSENILKTSTEAELSSQKACPAIQGKGSRGQGKNHGVRRGQQ